jgi:hypothetical protein
MSDEPVGYVVGTEMKPNTAYAFYFWAKREAGLGIGSMVKVQLDGEATIYGTVVEAHAYNDLPNALADYLASQGNPGMSAPTRRPEIRFFEAAVLRREPEEPVAAVGIGPVFEADAADLKIALRAERYEERGIPIGVYGSRDNPMPVFADPDYLLGTESGHLNVTGTSGLAAKTSYIQFLLQAIFQRFRGTGDDGVAAVLFNVKGGDLLYLDKPPRESIKDADRKIYEACGLRPEPFSNVSYVAPFDGPDQSQLKTLRNHPDLSDNATRGFCFGLKEVLQHAEVLLNRDDLDAKADSFLQFLVNDVAGKSDFRVTQDAAPMAVGNLRELVDVIREMLAVAERGDTNAGYRTHHAATIRKMMNRINGFATRLPGLVSDSGASVHPLPEAFTDRSVHVIDVSQCEVEAQDLVFAAVVSELRRRMEEKRLGVKRLIVVVDELNKYAPSGGRETYVLQGLRDIAARGRYLGLVLFGAQQFRSRVDSQVVGNCANSAYGQIQMEELANPIYTVYSPAVREKLATADPGEMMIRHPHFTQPVFIRFPIPSIMRGNDGMEKYASQPGKGIEQRIVEMAVKLGGGKTTVSQVHDALGELHEAEREESLNKIARELAAAERIGAGDPMEIIRRNGKRRPQKVAEREPQIAIPDDPFA